MSDGAAPLRIVCLGMRCEFTDTVLARLDDPAIEIVGSVIAMPELAAMGGGWMRPDRAHPDWTFAGSRSILRQDGFRQWLEVLQPDAIVVACFPWKLPSWLCALPKFGTINVHPSLLPHGRGPEPLFWTFRWNLRETGVTIHLVDAEWDSGPIVAQESVVIPEDATVASLERELAEIGGGLLRDALHATRRSLLSVVPQSLGSGLYAPTPGTSDLTVTSDWDADHAARFIRAVVGTYGPVTVSTPATAATSAMGERFLVVDVVVNEAAHSGTPAVSTRDDLVAMRFGARVLTLLLWKEAAAVPIQITI